MKIATRELILRLTAAAIGFAVTAVVFGVAIARSQEAPNVVRSHVTQLDSVIVTGNSINNVGTSRMIGAHSHESDQ